jgi:hypothetical protein
MVTFKPAKSGHFHFGVNTDGLEPEDLSDSELMSIVRDFFFF